MGGKHGVTLQQRFTVNATDAPAWIALREQWLADYPFENATHRQTIQRAAEADWLLRQEQRRYEEAESSLVCAYDDPLYWTGEQHKRLQIFERRLDRAQQSFLKWQRLAEQLRRARFTETLRREAHEWRREAQEWRRELHLSAQARNRAAEEQAAREAKSPFDDVYHRRPQHRVQYIEATVQDGVTVTTFSPPNPHFLTELTDFAQPYETVERKLRLRAPFPPEYHWFQIGSTNEAEQCWQWLTTVEQSRKDVQRELAEGNGHVLPSPYMLLPG